MPIIFHKTHNWKLPQLRGLLSCKVMGPLYSDLKAFHINTIKPTRIVYVSMTNEINQIRMKEKVNRLSESSSIFNRLLNGHQ